MHALLTRLLLLPLLSPLLAVLLIAAVNPRPWVALRLLTWTSPAWPLGGWLASGVAVGAGISAAGAALALQTQPTALRPRRQVRRGADGGREPTWAGPSRSASDPPPTVSVPFRVIRRASTKAPQAASSGGSGATSSGTEDWNTPADDDW